MAGSKWKYSTQMYEQNHLLETAHIQKAMKEGAYHAAPTKHFTIRERGKIREIASAGMTDKTVNHILCDEIFTPAILPYLQYDNSASQTGKGVAFHRKRLEAHMHKYFMHEHTNVGYVLLIDFSKYYANIPHDKCKAMLHKYAEKVTGGDTLLMVTKVTDSIFSNFGNDRSVDIGNQLSQNIGIAYPVLIDNYIKIVKGCKYYGRYTDDTYIIHRDKGVLQKLLEGIKAIADGLGIRINDHKTHLARIDKGFRHLQIYYKLTETGRLIRKVHPKAITRERRKLKAYKRLLTSGTMKIADIENCFKTWLSAHYKYMSRKQIRNISKLFTDLFGERGITWKRKHGRLHYPMAQPSTI